MAIPRKISAFTIAFIIAQVCFTCTARSMPGSTVDLAVSSTSTSTSTDLAVSSTSTWTSPDFGGSMPGSTMDLAVSSRSTSTSTDFGAVLGGAEDNAVIVVGSLYLGPSYSIVTGGNAVRRIMMRSQSFTASAPAGNIKTSPGADNPQKWFGWLIRKCPWLKIAVPALLGSACSITVICRCYFCSQRRSRSTRVRSTSNAESTIKSIDVELRLNVGTQEGVGQASS